MTLLERRGCILAPINEQNAQNKELEFAKAVKVVMHAAI